MKKLILSILAMGLTFLLLGGSAHAFAFCFKDTNYIEEYQLDLEGDRIRGQAVLVGDPFFPSPLTGNIQGGFANFAFGSEEATLPLGEPLMAVLEHRPEVDAVVVSVHRVVNGGRVVPLPGAVSVIDLTTLPHRDYSFDALGLTLWQDGFSGDPSSLHARVTFHRLAAVPGRVDRLESLLHLPPAERR